MTIVLRFEIKEYNNEMQSKENLNKLNFFPCPTSNVTELLMKLKI